MDTVKGKQRTRPTRMIGEGPIVKREVGWGNQTLMSDYRDRRSALEVSLRAVRNYVLQVTI